jgi:hypothetical protein
MAAVDLRVGVSALSLQCLKEIVGRSVEIIAGKIRVQLVCQPSRSIRDHFEVGVSANDLFGVAGIEDGPNATRAIVVDDKVGRAIH